MVASLVGFGWLSVNIHWECEYSLGVLIFIESMNIRIRTLMDLNRILLQNHTRMALQSVSDIWGRSMICLNQNED